MMIEVEMLYADHLQGVDPGSAGVALVQIPKLEHQESQ